MLLIIPIIALVCSVGYRLILGRPRFLRGEEGVGEVGRISVIVPARDEEGTIGALLESVAGSGVREVIVVDDGSEDRTAEISEGMGARVVRPGGLPEGWKGKPWACQQGAEAAEGEWLLFLDADTRVESGGMEALAGLTEEELVYSVCPYHRIETVTEEMSAFFNVLMVAGVDAFGGKPEREALFGQCLLISRKHYEEVGGHGAVRGEVLENFRLARVLEQMGIGRRCYLGKGAVWMRMFSGGMGELWGSWQKGFSTGAAGASRRALVWSSVWISGAMFALVGVLLMLWSGVGESYRWAAGLAYGVYVLQCVMAFRLVGNFSFLNAVLFPVSLMFYQVLFFASVMKRRRGGAMEWKGRDVG